MTRSTATCRKELSIAEAAYLAGLIDGEGGIYISKFKRANPHGFVYELCLRITNTDPSIINLCNKYGGCWQGQEQTSRWKIVYRWLFGKDDIRFYVPQLLPYLVIKRKQAEIILEALKCCKGSGFPQDKEKLSFLRKELDKFNRRGSKVGKYE